LGGIDELQAVYVFDHAARYFAAQHPSVAYDVHSQRRAHDQRCNKGYADQRQDCHIGQYPRPEHALAHLGLGEPAGNRIARRITNYSLIVIHLFHDLVTGIDTGATTYAHILQAIANVDAGRTDLNAQAAVNAIAHPGFFMIDTTRPPATRLAPD